MSDFQDSQIPADKGSSSSGEGDESERGGAEPSVANLEREAKTGDAAELNPLISKLVPPRAPVKSPWIDVLNILRYGLGFGVIVAIIALLFIPSGLTLSLPLIPFFVPIVALGLMAAFIGIGLATFANQSGYDQEAAKKRFPFMFGLLIVSVVIVGFSWAVFMLTISPIIFTAFFNTFALPLGLTGVGGAALSFGLAGIACVAVIGLLTFALYLGSTMKVSREEWLRENKAKKAALKAAKPASSAQPVVGAKPEISTPVVEVTSGAQDAKILEDELNRLRTTALAAKTPAALFNLVNNFKALAKSVACRRLGMTDLVDWQGEGVHSCSAHPKAGSDTLLIRLGQRLVDSQGLAMDANLKDALKFYVQLAQKLDTRLNGSETADRISEYYNQLIAAIAASNIEVAIAAIAEISFVAAASIKSYDTKKNASILSTLFGGGSAQPARSPEIELTNAPRAADAKGPATLSASSIDSLHSTQVRGGGAPADRSGATCTPLNFRAEPNNAAKSAGAQPQSGDQPPPTPKSNIPGQGVT